MASADASPPLRRLRDVLRRRVEEASLRQAAREVGMSPTGLRKFLDGADPYSETRRKLERWYVQESTRVYGAPDPEAARSALRVILRQLPPAGRSAGAARLLAALQASYKAAGVEPPPWLSELEREWQDEAL